MARDDESRAEAAATNRPVGVSGVAYLGGCLPLFGCFFICGACVMRLICSDL